MRCLAAGLLSLSLVGVTSCSSFGTAVLLTIARGSATPAGIVRVDLELSLGEMKKSIPLSDPGGREISFPTDVRLTVSTGGGTLHVTAIGRAASGAVLDRGVVEVTLKEGETVDATVTLGSSSASPRLVSDKPSFDFGTVLIGPPGSLASFTITNEGGQPTAMLSTQVTGPGYALEMDGCASQVLAPTMSCVVGVRFIPTAAGAAAGSLTVVDSAGGSATSMLTGNGAAAGALTLSPTSKDFGVVSTSSVADETFVAKNTGTTATGTLTTALTGNNKDNFLITASTCTGMLDPQATCSITVRFGPQSPLTTKSATLSIEANPGGTALSPLSGQAAPPASLGFSMSTFDFLSVDVGTTTAATQFTLTNNGGVPTGTLTTATTGDASQFIVTDDCKTKTLAPGGSCVVSVAFSPTTQGMKSLALTAQGAAEGMATLSLAGRGIDPVTLTVTTDGGTGTGSVTSSPPGISCPGTCSATFDRGVVVTLTATPNAGSTFGSWSNGITSADNPVMVTMDTGKTVTAAFPLKTFALTVTPSLIGGATGTVTSSSTPAPSPEINCGSTCTTNLVENATVTLTATPAAGFYFGGWGGDCSGTLLTCVLTMSAARNVTAKFTPANIMFASAATYSITTLAGLGTGGTQTLKVLDGADKACQAAAGAAGLADSGSFVAWLSASTRPAPGHIPVTARGWVRKDGRPFTDTISALTGNNQVFYPPVLDENGSILVGEERVWSATQANGSAYPASSACQDYASVSSSEVSATGERAAGAFGWTNQNSYGLLSCDQSARLYCFGTSRFAVVTPPALPPSYRYAFVSTSAFSPSTGLTAGADVKCNAEKGALPGTYKALMAPQGQTPASRFTARGVPVVRPDGVVVADLDTQLFANTLPLRAPIDVQGNGVYAVGFVTTGSTGPGVAGAATCADWTIATNAANATTGVMSLTLAAWFNLTDYACDLAINPRVYCLQE